MMEHRLSWILIGCAIGFIAGYLVRYVQEHLLLTREIRDEVVKIDRVVERRVDGDSGFAGNSWLTNVCLFLVVTLTAYSAFASQRTTDRVQRQQINNDLVSQCSQTFLAKTISALNARTQYSQQQTEANVKLQQAQATFLTGLLNRKSPDEGLSETRTYLQALGAYTSAAGKNSQQIVMHPYPTQIEYQNCLRSKD